MALNSSPAGISSQDFSLWNRLLELAEQGSRVVADSRQVQPGDIFVALPGSKVHGDDFIADALKRGAEYVLGANAQAVPEGAKNRFLACGQPALALGELAASRYQTRQRSFKLLGVTGTNGKTTICYLLEHLCNRAGYRVGVLGTVSYRWPGQEMQASLTTPDCLQTHELLARMQQEQVDLVCMEVSSHALQQQRLAGLEFDLALFSNLSQDHLDYHVDMQDYFRAKSRLFTSSSLGLPKAILNTDDAYGQELAGLCADVLGYGLQERELENYLQGRILSLGRQGLRLRMHYQGQSWELSSGLPGRHNALNLLAVQAVGLALGLGARDFLALQEFQNIPGRLQRVPNSKGLHIFIDYAHTPDALANVLAALQQMGFARLLVVFGCGGDRDREKRPLMGRAVAEYADLALLTSDNPRHEDPLQIMEQVLPGLQGWAQVVQEPDRRKAIDLALQELGPEDALLVAGKGHEEYQQIGSSKIKFSDLETVQELLQQRSQAVGNPVAQK
ncbi:MAG: UDP-N-acetylmuramoyl-L-alanyl-D-glutamate--2,6-diaminopimelate ligase [Thermodesulfobacteriota bacterium]